MAVTGRHGGHNATKFLTEMFCCTQSIGSLGVHINEVSSASFNLQTTHPMKISPSMRITDNQAFLTTFLVFLSHAKWTLS